MASPMHINQTNIGTVTNNFNAPTTYHGNGSSESVNTSNQSSDNRTDGEVGNGKKDAKDEDDENFVRESGPPQFDQNGSVVIPHDMFTDKHDVITKKRAEAFFDYYHLLDAEQRRSKSTYPKNEENIKSFMEILKNIRNDIVQTGLKSFESAAIDAINLYNVRNLGDDAPVLKAVKFTKKYLKELHAVAKFILPNKPLYVHTVLHQCVYTLNTPSGSYSTVTLPALLNAMGSKAFPPYSIDYVVSKSKGGHAGTPEKSAALKIANKNVHNTKRQFCNAEMGAFNMSVRVNSRQWKDYHRIEFTSVTANGSKAYIVIPLDYHRKLGCPETEVDLVSRLLNPPINPPTSISAGPSNQNDQQSNTNSSAEIIDQYHQILARLHAQGINPQDLMPMNQSNPQDLMLMNQSNPQDHENQQPTPNNVSFDSSYASENQLNMLSLGESENLIDQVMFTPTNESSFFNNQFPTPDGENSLSPTVASRFQDLFGNDLKKRMEDDAKQISRPVESTKVFASNICSKDAGVPGPKGKAHPFEQVLYYTIGRCSQYHDSDGIRKLSNKNKLFCLVEWKEAKPGEHGERRYTWEPIENLPEDEHRGKPPVLKEGVS